jgi:CheY-like chemotaxis protein
MADKKQLLIVDDAEDNVIFISQILEDHGYAFRVARDGKEALAAMRDQAPDAVLLDIMMPRKSGIAVFKEMKRDPALQSIPVIVVTGTSLVTGVDIATGDEAPKQAAGDDFSRRVGVILRESLMGLTPDGFVEKPIDPRALIEKINDIFR